MYNCLLEVTFVGTEGNSDVTTLSIVVSNDWFENTSKVIATSTRSQSDVNRTSFSDSFYS